MNRSLRVLISSLACVAVALGAAACGTERVHLDKNDPTPKADIAAATLFNQRCAGCHTLSFAGTYGSGQNPRQYEAINGPNFNVRCERPATRVLYAIENGGFSGAFMPQNIVVGQQARELAMFVARYAGRKAVTEPGSGSCQQQSIGTLPALPTNLAYGQTAGGTSTTSSKARTATTPSITPATSKAKPSKKASTTKKKKK